MPVPTEYIRILGYFFLIVCSRNNDFNVANCATRNWWVGAVRTGGIIGLMKGGIWGIPLVLSDSAEGGSRGFKTAH
jgi:hypothetical protein